MAALVRLARALLRSRRGTALLLLVALSFSSATLIAALSLRGSTQAAWQQLVASTAAADVRVMAFDQAQVDAALAELPPADAISISTTHFTTITAGQVAEEVRVTTAETNPVVDRLAVLSGDWPGNGVAVERSFAGSLGVQVGSTIAIAGRSTVVSAIVASAAQGPYPSTRPGGVYVTADVAADLGVETAHSTTSALRTSVAPPMSDLPFDPSAAIVQSAAELEASVLSGVVDAQVVLGTFALLLMVGVGGVLVIAVGGRARVDARMLGSLRAAGCAPGTAIGAYTVEHAAVACLAAAGGAALAWLAVPRLASAVLPPIGVPPGGPSLGTVFVGGLAVVIGTSVTAAFAAHGVVRSQRRVQAVASPMAARGASVLASWRAPVAVVLAAKDLLARPGRALVGMTGLSLAVAATVATLGMEATIAAEQAAGRSSDGDMLRALVYPLQTVVWVVAVVLVVVLVSVETAERRRETALLRAVGVTPGQIRTARWLTTAGLAVGGVLVGTPLGIGLFTAAYGIANGSSEGAVGPDALGLLVTAVVGVAIAGLAAVGAAHRETRNSPGALLAAE